MNRVKRKKKWKQMKRFVVVQECGCSKNVNNKWWNESKQAVKSKRSCMVECGERQWWSLYRNVEGNT